MRVDWVRVYAEPGEWRDPPDPSLTHRGIYSETHTNPTLAFTNIINTIDRLTYSIELVSGSQSFVDNVTIVNNRLIINPTEAGTADRRSAGGGRR